MNDVALAARATPAIITREDALAQGLKRFFTGEPCKYGHVAERMVGSRACCGCEAEREKKRDRAERRTEFGRSTNGGRDGHRKHEVSAQNRNVVSLCAGFGLRHDQIAMMIPFSLEDQRPIDQRMLEKHYAAELAIGKPKTLAQLFTSGMRQALGADAVYDSHGNQLRPAQPPVPALTIFLLKVLGRLREPARDLNVAGTAGGPIQHLDVGEAAPEILRDLTDEELAALESVSGKIASRFPRPDRG